MPSMMTKEDGAELTFVDAGRAGTRTSVSRLEPPSLCDYVLHFVLRNSPKDLHPRSLPYNWQRGRAKH